MQQITQYVTAYRADHDSIKRLLGKSFTSLRPVLRLNIELISSGATCCEPSVHIEFNTPVAAMGRRGWQNLACWSSENADIAFTTSGRESRFILRSGAAALLDIRFTRTGKTGGCPHESDNDGTFFGGSFSPAESIDGDREYCDCTLFWNTANIAAQPPLIREAVTIPPVRILGAYVVSFEREQPRNAL